VLHYLDQVDPASAREARARYGCFDHFDEDSQQYAYAAGFGLSASCEQEVVGQLQQLQQRAPDYLQRDGQEASDAFFHAQQNARLIMNAEQYYRTMFRARVSSWNLRDSHMADTLDALAEHLTTPASEPAKIVVWEHNSHIGDARATDMSRAGEWNVGQLVRERHGAQARLIGFTTFNGSVTAASRWDGPAQHKRLQDALPNSVEYLFHHTGPARFMLPLIAGSALSEALQEPRLERAIGVIYQPHTERQSHYFHARLPSQFDAVLHFDRTEALQQLETVGRLGGEAPETYPVGV
jgi:erythromycin esterase-like protein